MSGNRRGWSGDARSPAYVCVFASVLVLMYILVLYLLASRLHHNTRGHRFLFFSFLFVKKKETKHKRGSTVYPDVFSRLMPQLLT
jgi:hypothetical protein